MGIKKPIHCHDCVHFFVTWDPERPKGCRKHNFKSKKQPSAIVKEASGQECMSFQSKITKDKTSKI